VSLSVVRSALLSAPAKGKKLEHSRLWNKLDELNRETLCVAFAGTPVELVKIRSERLALAKRVLKVSK